MGDLTIIDHSIIGIAMRIAFLGFVLIGGWVGGIYAAVAASNALGTQTWMVLFIPIFLAVFLFFGILITYRVLAGRWR